MTEKMKHQDGLVVVDLSKSTIQRSRFERANPLSRLTFFWMSGIMSKGYSGKLTEDDLQLNQCDRAEKVAAEFNANWEKELKTKKPLLRSALFKSFGGEFLVAGIWKAMWACLVILAAFFFIRQIFVFVRDTATPPTGGAPPKWKGWVLSSCFFVCCWLLCVCLQQMSAKALQVGIKVRGSLMTCIYRKSLRVPNVGTEVGDIVSLISNDCARLMDGCTYFHYLWAGPAEAIAIVICMITMIGSRALGAVGVLLLLFVIQFFIGSRVVKNRAMGIATTDQRVQVVTESLIAIKTVKMYAWEKQFADLVARFREQELTILRGNSTLKSINILSVFGTPPTIAVVVFATWIFSPPYPKFKGEYVFTMLTLFNTLRLPMSFLPKAIKGLAESISALVRIQRFLLRDEVEPLQDRGVVGITMKDCSLSYGAPTPVIHDISLDLPKGKMMALVGPVGCGKSTLLMSILTECKVLKGSLSVGGSIAYVPQTPWIQHGTVRDNILFGRAFDDAKYRQVVFACALERDMEILTDGDQTEIGERGINLSGGQRQRIALARAVYSESEVQMLDNPLSAVDQHTCKHIFDYCIKDLLIAKGKTVILVTHQLELLAQCDYVGIMKNGRFLYYGKYDYDVVAKQFPAWAESQAGMKSETGSESTKKEENLTVKRVAKPKDHVPGKKDDGGNRKMVEEDKSSGRLGLGASFKLWCRNAGYGKCFFSLFLFILAQLTRTGGDYWLTIWTTADAGNPKNHIPLDPNYYLNYNNISKNAFMIIYAMFLVAFWFFMYCRGMWFYRIALDASTRLHNNMFRKVLRAPMLFFNITPLGRLINCVSKDMDTIDETLQDVFHITFIYFWILLVTLCFVTGVLYWFALVAFCLVVGFLALNNYYLKTTQKLKSYCGASAGPIFAHLAETLTGIAVVRAFRAQEIFKGENLKRIDRFHKNIFHLEMAQLWASHRLDWLGSLLVLSVAYFAVALDPVTSGFTASAFGFAVSNSFQMLLFFTACVRGLADIGSMLGAVERIDYYTSNIPSEAPLILEDRRPPAGWPKSGEIVFKHIVMRYAPNLDPALRDVTFTIKDGEKVGIVGRTGSGKSTSLLALFRLYESDSGECIVDGQDVAQYGLHDVRGAFAILPQEPVMFKGTVRSNLDPFGEKSDQELWRALEKAHLKEGIEREPDQLEMIVEDSGANFSLGQRQLFCLARAILKSSRILCLDEATAAMDLETDSMIQKVIKEEFGRSTILTIAHRLDTIIESDRILVMDAGKVAEFDSPVRLLCNPNSSFSKLVDQVGPEAARALRMQAFEVFRANGLAGLQEAIVMFGEKDAHKVMEMTSPEALAAKAAAGLLGRPAQH